MDTQRPSTTHAEDTDLRSPEGFLRALHPPGSRGKVSLLAKTENKNSARCFPAEEVYPVLDTWVMTTSYFCVTRYAGPRGGDRPVAQLTCLYADLDTYRRPELASLARDDLVEEVSRRIKATGLPDPSVMIDSGRGLYALWFIDPLPGQALRRWQAAQRCLVEMLAPLGADPACCDAARVLRIPGTVNEKSDRLVSVVRGNGHRYDFDDLADGIYKVAGRPTRVEFSARRQDRKDKKSSQTVRGLPPAARFAAVLRDLERLRLASWGGEVPEGVRNHWLHLVATALGFMLPAEEVDAEASRLAAQGGPGLPCAEVKATIKAAVRRAEAAPGSFRGPAGDSRLHYSGDRMAERLGVDRAMAEALNLEQIIPSDLRRDRRNARRRERRKAKGGQSRQEYLENNSISKDQPWAALGISKSTWYKRGLHKFPTEDEANSVNVSAPDEARTGPVPQQGALGPAEGPELSLPGSGNREIQPSPARPADGPENPEIEQTGPQLPVGDEVHLEFPAPGGPEDAPGAGMGEDAADNMTYLARLDWGGAYQSGACGFWKSSIRDVSTWRLGTGHSRIWSRPGLP